MYLYTCIKIHKQINRHKNLVCASRSLLDPYLGWWCRRCSLCECVGAPKVSPHSSISDPMLSSRSLCRRCRWGRELLRVIAVIVEHGGGNIDVDGSLEVEIEVDSIEYFHVTITIITINGMGKKVFKIKKIKQNKNWNRNPRKSTKSLIFGWQSLCEKNESEMVMK